MVEKLTKYTEYWQGIVVPDYEAFGAKNDDLRLAFHAAIALFHMSDWVYLGHEADIRSSFQFTDKTGAVLPVRDVKQFANALRDQCPHFELIRGIANSAKHLALSRPGTHSHSPSNAANSSVRATGYGAGGFGSGPCGGSPRVMLAGPNGDDLEFSMIAGAVYKMWKDLAAQHGWTL
jgi:hypothetical protein